MTSPTQNVDAEELKEVLQQYDHLSPEEKAEIDKLIADDVKSAPWRPMINIEQPGLATPQQKAYDCKADILLYGGAAGGGKTSLMIGLALTAHSRSAIFRREVNRLGSIESEIIRIRKTRKGFNSQKHTFNLGNDKEIQLGGMQYELDKEAFQGQDRDLMCWDELTQFLESQFRYVITWNRLGGGTTEDQRCRVVCASNPPTTAEGDWVVKFWAPWLDKDHPNPALPGELRWFISDEEGNDEEVLGPEDKRWSDKLQDFIEPRSRTFIPSSVDDNVYLANSGYKATLQALPEPLRSQMLQGDFLAGKEDDPWQVIPTSWIEAAMDRWTPDRPKGLKMSALGFDPTRGGKDNAVLSPRYGNWFAELIVQKGVTTPDGAMSAALAVQHVRDGAPIMIDIIGGAGASTYDHLKANNINVEAVDGRRSSGGRDLSGTLAFSNERSEMWFRMREALDPANGENIALPRDNELKADLAAPMWKLTVNKVVVEGKSTERKEGFGDLKQRLGRSPDRGDAVVYALREGKFRNRLHPSHRQKRTNSRYNAHKPFRRK